MFSSFHDPHCGGFEKIFLNIMKTLFFSFYEFLSQSTYLIIIQDLKHIVDAQSEFCTLILTLGS